MLFSRNEKMGKEDRMDLQESSLNVKGGPVPHNVVLKTKWIYILDNKDFSGKVQDQARVLPLHFLKILSGVCTCLSCLSHLKLG